MSLTSGVKLHIHLLNVVVRLIVFLTSSTLISRSVSESPLEFEITRVDGNSIISRFFFKLFQAYINPNNYFDAKGWSCQQV